MNTPHLSHLQKRVDPIYFYLLLSVFISFVFGTFLSSQRVTDPFLYYDISFIKSVSQNNQMVFPTSGPYQSLSYVQGRSMLMSQLSSLLGIPPETLQFFPLGTIILSIVYYYFSFRFLSSPALACLVSIYLTLNLSHATALYSVFAYALGLPLLLAILIIGLEVFSTRSTPPLVLILIIFLSVHLIHYTFAAWAILFLGAASILIVFKDRLYTFSPSRNHLLSFTLAFTVIYLFFNQMLYSSFLPIISQETLDGALQRFLSYISIEPPQMNISPYEYTRGSAIGLISSFTLVIILLPIIIGFIHDVRSLWKEKEAFFEKNPLFPIVCAIIFIGVVDMLSYTIRGSLSTKAFSIIYPIISIYYLSRLGFSKKRIAIFSILLVCTSLVKIFLFFNTSYLIGPGRLFSDFQAIQPSTAWIKKHFQKEQYTILSDMNLYGVFLLSSEGTGQHPVLQGFTESSYTQLIEGDRINPDNPPDLLAIDNFSLEPVVGFIWKRLDPLLLYKQGILANPNINIIFDSGDVYIAKPVIKAE